MLKRINKAPRLKAGGKLERYYGSRQRASGLALLFYLCVLCLGCPAKTDAAASKKRDPFIPLVTPEGRLLQALSPAQEGDLRLEGLIYDVNGSSLAIVNGAVARIGDSVYGYRVIKIEKDKVLFMKDGQMLEISFQQKKKEESLNEDAKK